MDRELRRNAVESTLLDLTRNFLLELQSVRALPGLSLTALLDSELGIDSLGKAELLHRMEKHFSVTLTNYCYSTINTLQAAAEIILASNPVLPLDLTDKSSPLSLQSAWQNLKSFSTVPAILKYYAHYLPHHLHAQSYDGLKKTGDMYYGELWQTSSLIAKNLIAANIKPREQIAIQETDNLNFIALFCGIILAGAVPVLCSSQDFFRTPNLSSLLSENELELPEFQTDPDDTAFVFDTQRISHRELLSSLQKEGAQISIRPADSILSVLPLCSSTGLTAWLMSLYHGIPFFLVNASNACQWLWSVHYRQATLVLAPETFYKKVCDGLPRKKLEGLDLGVWRLALTNNSMMNEKIFTNLTNKLSRYHCNTKLHTVFDLTHSTSILSENKIFTLSDPGRIFISTIRKITDTLTLITLLIYTIYVWSLFFILLPFYLASVILAPKHKARIVSRIWMRNFFRLIFCPVSITGINNIPPDNRVIFVSNHACYADGLLLTGILPENVVFTVRKESCTTPVIGVIIKKFDYLVIDRQDFIQSLASKNRMSACLQKGLPLVVFSEATFDYATGLRPFKMGAFVVAAETQTPICPISIRGSRSLWRCYTWLAKPSAIQIVIGKPIFPKGNGWDAAIDLHNQIKNQILEHCGEPVIDIIAAGSEGLPEYSR